MPDSAQSHPAAQADREAAVIDVSDLAVRFGEHTVEVVDGVSFAVGPGRTLCLVGESGCGKSVTALAIMGLLPSPPARVTRGRALFEGRDLLTMSSRSLADWRGHRLAMIFQEPMTSLNPVFTIGEQIVEGILRHHPMTRDQARKRALEALDKVRIPAAETRFGDYPHQLSGGMRQRVMIAMALVNRPTLLIADEPTTALDVTIQAQILELIRELQSETGAALILITHDLGVVAEVADEVAVMYAGRIVESGPVGAIFDDPQHPYTLGLMSSLPSVGRREGRLVTVPGSVPPAELMPEGCRFAGRCAFTLPDCIAARPLSRELGDDHAVACIRAPLEQNVEGSA
ncbi:MAG: ABC transporter ATP-binding protein [Kiloniellales bacterium]